MKAEQSMRELGAHSLDVITALLADAGARAPMTAEEIVRATGAVPRHAWLVRRWLAALVADGRMRHAEGHYELVRTSTEFAESAESTESTESADDTVDLGRIYAEMGFPPMMAEFHRETLKRLPALLCDEITLPQLLFREGDVVTALAAYQINAFTSFLNDECGRLVLEAAQTRAEPLRVVEIGGGAGLTTLAVLTALGETPVRYRFTDVSRLFTLAADERHPAVPGFSSALLDMNTDFAGQGFPAGSAQVVLAGNALHNAVHCGRTLARIRALLEPGGELVFTESVEDNPAVLTSMQFLLSPPPGAPAPGSADRRVRTGSVFLTADGWAEELAAAGFEPPAVLPEDESPLAAAGQRLFHAVAR